MLKKAENLNNGRHPGASGVQVKDKQYQLVFEVAS